MEQLKKERRILKILFLALGLNKSLYFSILTRKDDDSISKEIINTDIIGCEVPEGINWINNIKLTKIIHNLYHYKRRNKIIYII